MLRLDWWSKRQLATNFIHFVIYWYIYFITWFSNKPVRQLHCIKSSQLGLQPRVTWPSTGPIHSPSSIMYMTLNQAHSLLLVPCSILHQACTLGTPVLLDSLLGMKSLLSALLPDSLTSYLTLYHACILSYDTNRSSKNVFSALLINNMPELQCCGSGPIWTGSGSNLWEQTGSGFI